MGLERFKQTDFYQVVIVGGDAGDVDGKHAVVLNQFDLRMNFSFMEQCEALICRSCLRKNFGAGLLIPVN